jgi:hypothetical protein
MVLTCQASIVRLVTSRLPLIVELLKHGARMDPKRMAKNMGALLGQEIMQASSVHLEG